MARAPGLAPRPRRRDLQARAARAPGLAARSRSPVLLCCSPRLRLQLANPRPRRRDLQARAARAPGLFPGEGDAQLPLSHSIGQADRGRPNLGLNLRRQSRGSNNSPARALNLGKAALPDRSASSLVQQKSARFCQTLLLASTRAVLRSEQIKARGRRNPEAHAVYVEGFQRPRTKSCDAYRHGASVFFGARGSS